MTKILIVEDDLYVRAGLKELLVQSKYIVEALEDGNEIEKHIKMFNPDLVICDIMMKKRNGYEVLEKLRSENCLIPFIFLTAKCELQDIRKGMSLGADDYFVKPYRAKDLLKAINFRINKHVKIGEDFKKEKDIIKKKNELNKDSIIVIHNKTSVFVKYDNIVYIQAESEYSNIFLKNGEKLFVRKLLKWWEENLPSDKFLRIHRSNIVNVNYIKSIYKSESNSQIISLKRLKTELPISYRFARKIKNILSF